jgi:hypothetical protein
MNERDVNGASSLVSDRGPGSLRCAVRQTDSIASACSPIRFRYFRAILEDHRSNCPLARSSRQARVGWGAVQPRFPQAPRRGRLQWRGSCRRGQLLPYGADSRHAARAMRDGRDAYGCKLMSAANDTTRTALSVWPRGTPGTEVLQECVCGRVARWVPVAAQGFGLGLPPPRLRSLVLSARSCFPPLHARTRWPSTSISARRR